MRNARPRLAAESDKSRGNEDLPKTLAGTVYESLRADILSAQLEPDSKLRIEFLSRRYRTGQIPIREALNRLTSEGLVERREQRGFVVSPVSAEDLTELTKTRAWLEGIALAESIASHTREWEEGVVLAFHRLSQLPRSMSRSVYRVNPEWERLHRDFHRSLIAGCGSRWLLSFCLQLADQSFRYRQIAFKKAFRGRTDTDGHRAIMEAAIGGDSGKAVKLLQKHLRFTARTILENGDALKSVFPAIKVRQPRSRRKTPRKTTKT
jgi:DNA-binding GntR family transcriptional regulator